MKREGKGQNSKSYAANKKSDVKRVVDYNDASWYYDDPNLLTDATNLSFNNAVGGYLPDEISATTSTGLTNETVPGVMTMVYIPTVGISTDFNSPINVAKAKLYTYVRHANSGHSNYDSPDLMQYVMAKTSIDCLFWHFARAYACAFQYHQTNRYLPKALIEAMGIDADDIVANLADFRAQLNIAAVKLNALFIPNNFGYYRRQAWMNSNVFLDSNSPKAQLYVYVPYNAWIYNESGADVGNLTPQVVYQPHISKLKYTDIVTILNNLINPLVSSEDINIMSGDMLKAYGEDKRVVLPTLPESYDITFTYSEEVLEQIHNTTLVGELFDGYTPKIIQNASTGLLEFDPLINADNYATTTYGTVSLKEDNYLPYLESRKRFDLITNDTKPERIIVASRNTAMYKPLSSTPTVTPSHVDSCGSELFLFADIYLNTYEMAPTSPYALSNKGLARYRLHYINMIAFGASENYLSRVINAFSKFDWAPICIFCYLNVDEGKGENSTGTFIDPNDINNYTVINRTNLAKLHQLALLTELDVTKK